MILLSTSDPHLPIFLLTCAVSWLQPQKTSERKDYQSSHAPNNNRQRGLAPKTSLLAYIYSPTIYCCSFLFWRTSLQQRLFSGGGPLFFFSSQRRWSSAFLNQITVKSRVRSIQLFSIQIEFILMFIPSHGQGDFGFIQTSKMFVFWAGTLCPHICCFEFKKKKEDFVNSLLGGL